MRDWLPYQPRIDSRNRSLIRPWSTAVVWILAPALLAGHAHAGGHFVATNGNDSQSGTISSPWRGVKIAISRLVPGDTLYVRAGQYFESVDATVSGTAASPIVVRAYPGEQAILDSGFPEFQARGNAAWELVNSQTGEYRSTAVYGTEKVHGYVIPDGAYENGRMALVPYDTTSNFRATTDQYNLSGFYVGPGTLSEPDGHIRIRLAKTYDFRETEARYGPILSADPADPRGYSIFLSQASHTLLVTGSHLVFLDLVFHPGDKTIRLGANAHHIRFEGITAWMGASTIEASDPGIHHITVTRSRLYGDGAYWIFFSDMKDAPFPADLFRGTSVRLDQGAHDFEISYCHIRGSGQDLIGTNGSEYNLLIHHNRLENALDDALELEGALGRTEVYENLILNALSGVSPGQSSSVFPGPLLVYRNVMGLLRNPPVNREEEINTWNGGRRHGYEYMLKQSGAGFGCRNTHFYHNTMLLLNSAGQGINLTPQHPESAFVANNLLVTVNGPVNGTYRTGAGQVVNGNLYWKMNSVETKPLLWSFDDVPALNAAMGLEAQGLGATPKHGTDPKFAGLQLHFINRTFMDWGLTANSERISHADVFLGASSPARGAGIVIPPHPTLGTLPDTRASRDIGAIPFGTPPSEYAVFPFNAGTPSPPETRSILELRVATGSDDAEESPTGAVSLTSDDLELVNEAGLQTVGLRFSGVGIPAGATITRAYLQFKADELQSEVTALTIQGNAADHAPGFGAVDFDLSSRPRTSATVSWSPQPWSVLGAAGPEERCPDLKVVLQEIVSRPGWTPGNAIALIIRGTGHRTGESYEGDAPAAPLLHVEFTGGPRVNQPPLVGAGPDETISMPLPALLEGTAADEGLPEPSSLTPSWLMVGGPAPVTLSNPAGLCTQARFSTPGTYRFRLAVSDGQRSAADSVTVVVQAAGTPVLLDRRIPSGEDDAEESNTGVVDLLSGDLELILDAGPQVVGMRFPDFGVPRGATIQTALLQLTADEAQSVPTSLTLRAQASDDAPALVNATGNLTARPLTAAQVVWTPPPWPVVGAAGADQRSPDLSAVIQEIVNRPGWMAGKALAIVITGSGHRTAESFEGDAAEAPLLHVEYVYAGPLAVPDPDLSGLRLGGVMAPSPSRGRATLRFATRTPGKARVDLFDLEGRRLRTLFSSGVLAPGSHSFEIDGRGENGARLSSGIYFYRLVSADGAWSGRFAIVE